MGLIAASGVNATPTAVENPDGCYKQVNDTHYKTLNYYTTMFNKNNVTTTSFARGGCFFIALFTACFFSAAAQTDTVSITINTQKITGDFKPVWSYFGYDEANYTTMKDGKKLLPELAALSSAPVYVRVHNLLTTGDGKADLKWSSTNAYTEDKDGRPVYNWQGVDAIFDEMVKNGIRPIAEIGFMPEAMSVKPQPYKHHWKPGVPYDSIYTGWAYPPKDYKKWAALIYEWVKHCVNKYGEKEVKT